LTIRHFTNAGYNRSKSSDNWNKTRKKNRWRAVFFVKTARLFGVTLFENKRIIASKKLFTNRIAKSITNRIAGNRRDKTTQRQPDNRQKSLGGQKTGGKKQRIAGKEKTKKQT